MGGLTDRAQARLNQVRGIFGAENVTGISGNRGSAAASGSQHRHGDAIDFSVKDGRGGLLDSKTIAQTLVANGVTDFGQLIYYNGSTHVHIGEGNRGEVLEATKSGGKTSYARRAISDLAGGLVDKAKSAAGKALADAAKGFAFGGPAGAAAGAAGGVSDLIGGGGGGLLSGLNPFEWLADYMKETGFFTRAAMVLVGAVIVIAALAWVGKSKIGPELFKGAIKGS